MLPFSVCYQRVKLTFNEAGGEISATTKIWLKSEEVVKAGSRILLNYRGNSIKEVLVNDRRCTFVLNDPLRSLSATSTTATSSKGQFSAEHLDVNFRAALEMSTCGELQLTLPPLRGEETGGAEGGSSEGDGEGEESDYGQQLHVTVNYSIPLSGAAPPGLTVLRSGSFQPSPACPQWAADLQCMYTGRRSAHGGRLLLDPDGVRCWLPCVDSLGQRCVFDVTIAGIPDSLSCVCSGSRISRRVGEGRYDVRYLSGSAVPAASVGWFLGRVERYSLPLYQCHGRVWAVQQPQFHPDNSTSSGSNSGSGSGSGGGGGGRREGGGEADDDDDDAPAASTATPGSSGSSGSVYQELVCHTTLGLDLGLRYLHKFCGKTYTHRIYTQVFVPGLLGDCMSFDGFSLLNMRHLHSREQVYMEGAVHLLQVTAYLTSWFAVAFPVDGYCFEFLLHGLVQYLATVYTEFLFGEEAGKLRFMRMYDAVVALERSGRGFPLVVVYPEAHERFLPHCAEYVWSKGCLLFHFMENRVGSRDPLRRSIQQLLHAPSLSEFAAAGGAQRMAGRSQRGTSGQGHGHDMVGGRVTSHGSNYAPPTPAGGPSFAGPSPSYRYHNIGPETPHLTHNFGPQTPHVSQQQQQQAMQPPVHSGSMAPPTPYYSHFPQQMAQHMFPPPTPSMTGFAPPTPSVTNFAPPTPNMGGFAPPTPSVASFPPPTPSLTGFAPPTPSVANFAPPTPNTANFAPPTPSLSGPQHPPAQQAGFPPSSPFSGMGFPPPSPQLGSGFPPPSPYTASGFAPPTPAAAPMPGPSPRDTFGGAGASDAGSGLVRMGSGVKSMRGNSGIGDGTTAGGSASGRWRGDQSIGYVNPNQLMHLVQTNGSTNVLDLNDNFIDRFLLDNASVLMVRCKFEEHEVRMDAKHRSLKVVLEAMPSECRTLSFSNNDALLRAMSEEREDLRFRVVEKQVREETLSLAVGKAEAFTQRLVVEGGSKRGPHGKRNKDETESSAASGGPTAAGAVAAPPAAVAKIVRSVLLDPQFTRLVDMHCSCADSYMVEQVAGAMSKELDVLCQIRALRHFVTAMRSRHGAAAMTGTASGEVLRKRNRDQLQLLVDVLRGSGPVQHDIGVRAEAARCMAAWQCERAPGRLSEVGEGLMFGWEGLDALTVSLLSMFVDDRRGAPEATTRDLVDESGLFLCNTILYALSGIQSYEECATPPTVVQTLLFFQKQAAMPARTEVASRNVDAGRAITGAAAGRGKAGLIRYDGSYHRAWILLCLSRVRMGLTAEDERASVRRICSAAQLELSKSVSDAYSEFHVGRRPIIRMPLDGIVAAAALTCLAQMDVLQILTGLQSTESIEYRRYFIAHQADSADPSSSGMADATVQQQRVLEVASTSTLVMSAALEGYVRVCFAKFVHGMKMHLLRRAANQPADASAAQPLANTHIANAIRTVCKIIASPHQKYNAAFKRNAASILFAALQDQEPQVVSAAFGIGEYSRCTNWADPGALTLLERKKPRYFHRPNVLGAHPVVQEYRTTLLKCKGREMKLAVKALWGLIVGTDGTAGSAAVRYDQSLRSQLVAVWFFAYGSKIPRCLTKDEVLAAEMAASAQKASSASSSSALVGGIGVGMGTGAEDDDLFNPHEKAPKGQSRLKIPLVSEIFDKQTKLLRNGNAESGSNKAPGGPGGLNRATGQAAGSGGGASGGSGRLHFSLGSRSSLGGGGGGGGVSSSGETNPPATGAAAGSGIPRPVKFTLRIN